MPTTPIPGETQMTANTAIFDWNGPLGLPEFDKIGSGDFAEAFELGLDEDRSEINEIAEQAAEPTFENTIEELEISGDKLNRTSAIFWNLLGADSDDELRALEREIAPRLSRHMSETSANKELF